MFASISSSFENVIFKYPSRAQYWRGSHLQH